MSLIKACLYGVTLLFIAAIIYSCQSQQVQAQVEEGHEDEEIGGDENLENGTEIETDSVE